MAIAIGTALALGKAAFSVGKTIKGRMDSKKAQGQGAAAVDPSQSALVNLRQRQRRASETGTSNVGIRNRADKDFNTLQRRLITGGKRDLGDYIKLKSATEGAITDATSKERLGLTQEINKVTQDVSDRRMDLVEADKYKKMQDAEALKSTGSKNAKSQAPALQEALKKGLEGFKAKRAAKKAAMEGALDNE